MNGRCSAGCLRFVAVSAAICAGALMGCSEAKSADDATQPITAVKVNANANANAWQDTIMDRVKRKLTEAWRPFGLGWNSSTVRFHIAHDGTISGAKIVKSTGDKEFDVQALMATRGVNIGELPTGAPDSVDVEFTFDWNFGNSHNQSNSTSNRAADDVASESTNLTGLQPSNMPASTNSKFNSAAERARRADVRANARYANGLDSNGRPYENNPFRMFVGVISVIGLINTLIILLCMTLTFLIMGAWLAFKHIKLSVFGIGDHDLAAEVPSKKS